MCLEKTFKMIGNVCLHCIAQLPTTCSFCVASHIVQKNARPLFCMSAITPCPFLQIVNDGGYCYMMRTDSNYHFGYKSNGSIELPDNVATTAQSQELLWLYRWSVEEDLKKDAKNLSKDTKTSRAVRERIQMLLSDIHGTSLTAKEACSCLWYWYNFHVVAHDLPEPAVMN